MTRALWFAKLVGIGCLIAIMFFVALAFITQLGADINQMQGLP